MPCLPRSSRGAPKGRRFYDHRLISQPPGRSCDANPTSKTLASAQTHPPQNLPPPSPFALSSSRPTYTASRLFFSASHPPLVIPTGVPRLLRHAAVGSRHNRSTSPNLAIPSGAARFSLPRRLMALRAAQSRDPSAAFLLFATSLVKTPPRCLRYLCGPSVPSAFRFSLLRNLKQKTKY